MMYGKLFFSVYMYVIHIMSSQPHSRLPSATLSWSMHGLTPSPQITSHDDMTSQSHSRPAATHIHERICVCICVCMYLWTCLSMCICTCVLLHLCLSLCICACLRPGTCVTTFACLYVSVCVHVDATYLLCICM